MGDDLATYVPMLDHDIGNDPGGDNRNAQHSPSGWAEGLRVGSNLLRRAEGHSMIFC